MISGDEKKKNKIFAHEKIACANRVFRICLHLHFISRFFLSASNHEFDIIARLTPFIKFIFSLWIQQNILRTFFQRYLFFVSFSRHRRSHSFRWHDLLETTPAHIESRRLFTVKIYIHKVVITILLFVIVATFEDEQKKKKKRTNRRLFYDHQKAIK